MSNNDGLTFNEDDAKPAAAAPRQEERATPRNDRDSEHRRDDRSNRRDRDDRDDRPRKAWNMGNLARMQGRPSLGGISDAALKTMIDAFKEESFDKPGINPDIQRTKFQVIPFTGAAAGSTLPSLLVCLPLKALAVTLVYTLVIEQPGPPAVRTLNDRGDQFDALVLPEDRLTERYQKAIQDEVIGLGHKRVILIGSQVILATTVALLTEKENSYLINNIYDNAIDAICGYRQNILDKTAGNRGGEFRLNPEAIERGDRLETSFDFSGKAGTDSSGLPIRTDALVTLFYSSQSEDEDNIYNRVPMAEVRVGLDLFLAESEQPENSRLGRRNSRNRRDDRDDEAFLQPVININSITGIDDYPYSLELVQLMLANTALLSNDFRYTNILRPRSHIGGGLKPVSKLADLILLSDLDEETKKAAMERVSPNMSDDDFADFVDACIRPRVAIGMIVPSSGEKSWVLSIYERIATCKKGSEIDDLVTILFDSADVLTGNRFRPAYKKLCGGSMPIPVSTNGSRVLIGTWSDPDTNTTRDLREWNVPAVLSKVGAKNIDLARDYQWTFEDDRHSVEYNIAERHSMLSKFVPNLHTVGTAEQLILKKEYLQALAESLNDARMSSIVASGDTLSGRRNVGRSFFSDASGSDLGSSKRRGNDSDRRGGGRGLFGGNDDGDRYY